MLRLLSYLNGSAVVYDYDQASRIQKEVVQNGKTWTEGSTTVAIHTSRDSAKTGMDAKGVDWKRVECEGSKIYIGMRPVSTRVLKQLFNRAALWAILAAGQWASMWRPSD